MTDKSLWCLTTFFNPVGYKSRVLNHHIFTENLQRQNVNLLTIELSFGNDDFYLMPGENIIHMHSNSVLWQKERMLNYAISKLPKECKYIAWVDGDVIFGNNQWPDMLIDKLQTNDVVQLFEKAKNLPPNELQYGGKDISTERSIVWQSKNFPNWLEKRRTWKLPYATIGFAWAAKRSIFDNIGMYDRHVLGSNDNLVVDCCLNSFDLHHYWNNINPELKEDMQKWTKLFGIGVHKIDYLPITIYHLWHGAKKYRGYINRESIVKKYNFNPLVDIRIENNVYEWNSEKLGLHEECRNYFYSRREDDTAVPEDAHVRL